MPLDSARFLDRDGNRAHGIKHIFTQAPPGAGNELRIVVPGGEQWQIRAGQITFTTSAAVANRNVSLRLTVDGAQVWTVNDPSNIAASNSVVYNVAQVDDPALIATAGGLGFFYLPRVMLPQGATLTTVTTNRDVGDTYTNINLYVARWYLTDQELDAIEAFEIREYTKLLAEIGATP